MMEPSHTSGLVVSIVSHGHGEQVRDLLLQMAAISGSSVDTVVLTLNQAEPELQDALDADGVRKPWPFDLIVHQNLSSQGFGDNHNQAFRRYALPRWRDLGLALEAGCFAVVNPDVRLQADPFVALQTALVSTPKLGCAYPVQVDAQGGRQDFERMLPTPVSIWQRVMWHLKSMRVQSDLRSVPPGQPEAGESPDWVNAAFWLVRAKAWREIDGFDHHYFMYGEDVDFCLRLQLAGWSLQRIDRAVVEHEPQRGSHRNLQHAWWHMQSLMQLWQSKAYADYKRMKLRKKTS